MDIELTRVCLPFYFRTYLAIVPQNIRPNMELVLPVTLLRPGDSGMITALLLDDNNKTLGSDRIQARCKFAFISVIAHAAIENVNSIDERRSKKVKSRFFDCHLSQWGDKWQSKHWYKWFSIRVRRLSRVFSIAAYPSCIRDIG